MTKQTQTVLQETFETCMMAMEDLIVQASDLESIRQFGDATELREVIGKIDQFVTDLRLKHS